jgi:hypothetical protein
MALCKDSEEATRQKEVALPRSRRGGSSSVGIWICQYKRLAATSALRSRLAVNSNRQSVGWC